MTGQSSGSGYPDAGRDTRYLPVDRPFATSDRYVGTPKVEQRMMAASRDIWAVTTGGNRGEKAATERWRARYHQTQRRCKRENVPAGAGT